jgi:hypothetical protein
VAQQPAASQNDERISPPSKKIPTAKKYLVDLAAQFIMSILYPFILLINNIQLYIISNNLHYSKLNAIVLRATQN